jgi:hypothetical protein
LFAGLYLRTTEREEGGKRETENAKTRARKKDRQRERESYNQ